ncbi:MarR family winged helix-turn-helix transcriptional regulator [Endothiovibrio diazotrophicus]
MLSTIDQLGPLIGELSHLWRARLDERLRPLGLSQSRWRVLVFLARRGDGVVQKTLAQWLGIEGPSLARLLDRMAADGWVERRESPTDRRAKTVHLTARAHATIEEIRAIAAALRDELLATIPHDELVVCVQVLDTIKRRAEGPERPAENPAENPLEKRHA